MKKRQQLDIFEDDPARMAQLFRASAEAALKDVQFSAIVRQDRHDHYLREAERLEALAAMCSDQAAA